MKKLQRNILLFVASIALGSSLMSYKAYAQANTPVQPVERLAVFDSQGKRVGNVIGMTGSGPEVLPVIALEVERRCSHLQ